MHLTYLPDREEPFCLLNATGEVVASAESYDDAIDLAASARVPFTVEQSAVDRAEPFVEITFRESTEAANAALTAFLDLALEELDDLEYAYTLDPGRMDNVRVFGAPKTPDFLALPVRIRHLIREGRASLG